MAITRVQGNSVNTVDNTHTSLAITLPTGVTQGNLLVVAFCTGNNATTITPPDGSWTQAALNQPAGANATIEVAIYWLVVDAGHAGGTSWTWTISAAHSIFIGIEEWNATNGWPANPVDVTALGDTAGAPVQATTITSGTAGTTAQGEELWIAALAYKGSAQTESGITAGWTKDLEATLSAANTMTMLYQVTSATGAPACQYTIGSAQYWAGCVVAFKDTVAVGGGSQTKFIPRALSALIAYWYRSLAARVVMRVQNTPTLAARVRMQTRVTKSLTVRFLERVQTARTLPARVRMAVQGTKTLVVRARMRQLASVALPARARIRIQVGKVLAVRFIARQLATRTLPVRLVMRGISKLLQTRVVIRVQKTLTLIVRARMQQLTTRTLTVRAKERVQGARALVARAVIRQLATRTLVTRTRIRASATRTLVVRAVLSSIANLITRTLVTRVKIRTAATKTLQMRTIQRVQATRILVVRFVMKRLTKVLQVRARMSVGATKTLTARAGVQVRQVKTLRLRSRIQIGSTKTLRLRTKISSQRQALLVVRFILLSHELREAGHISVMASRGKLTAQAARGTMASQAGRGTIGEEGARGTITEVGSRGTITVEEE